jgi:hypothetical protein
MPQVIVNRQKWKERVEGLELSRELAKQVLSQLSYTPMLCIVIYLQPFRKLEFATLKTDNPRQVETAR